MNIICLGVQNMKRSVKFYRDGLGFRTKETGEDPDIVFFSNNGTKLSLYPLKKLAQDINEADPPRTGKGFAGITLAYNAKNKEEVHEIVETARKAGAAILKEPQDTFWGGHHAYFADLDGYCWEVAWGPMFTFDENDMLVI
jgi:catechol 2,3-dioxygenase-like lactoylglutathione lyase family enzyme